MTPAGKRMVDRYPRARGQLGLFGLCLFACFAWLGTTIAHVTLLGLALLLLAEGPAAWKVLRRDPFVRVSAVFFAYLFAAAAWASVAWPETARQQWASVWPWSSLWLFFVVAWWLKGRWARIWAVMLLAPLGLIGGIIRRSDWDRWSQWLDGERYEFGYTSLGLSFLALVIVLGSVTFLHRIARLAQSGWHRALLLLLTLGFQSFFLFVLMVAQSRGAWLSLVFGLLLFALLSLRSGLGGPEPEGRLSALALPAAVCAASILAALIFFRNAIVERFRSEIDVVPELLSADLAKVPYSSGWSRLHLTFWGVRMFAQHPFFGWGPGGEATRYLAREGYNGDHGGFLSVVWHFAHLHNAYVEILVRFGLLGSLIFVGGFAIFVRSMIQSRRSGIVPEDFYIFFQVVMFTTLFLCVYEFRLLHTDFRFFVLLFGGIAYTFALHGDSRQAMNDTAG